MRPVRHAIVTMLRTRRWRVLSACGGRLLRRSEGYRAGEAKTAARTGKSEVNRKV
jgi:hypothetical protein